MSEPEYYNQYGLSPLQAFEQGLMSREQFIGFCKGNVIKYTCRAGSKDDALLDIIKAMDYLTWLHKALKDGVDDSELSQSTEEFKCGCKKNKIPVNGQKYNASELQGNIFSRTFNKLKK